MWKVAPLKSTFMLAAMLGFMITIIYTSYGRISQDWGFALGFVFALMFIASLISMTQAPIDMQLEMSPDLIRSSKKKKPTKRKKK
jgi:disulfide bond formation protein DsbB